MEIILKLDKKGRIHIPVEIRRQLGLEGAVRARVEGDRLILEPLRNPLDRLVELIVDDMGDIEEDIVIFRGKAEKALREARLGGSH